MHLFNMESTTSSQKNLCCTGWSYNP